MRLVTLGVGRAGGRIVDGLLAASRRDGTGVVRAALALDTDPADLRALDAVPGERRIALGDGRTEGVGGDVERAAGMADRARGTVIDAMDGLPASEADALLVVAGLGGGTGGGAAPVVAGHLRDVYDCPVYALGVVPGEDGRGVRVRNAGRSLAAFVEASDNVVLVEDDALGRNRGDATVASAHERIEADLVRRLHLLLAAGEGGAADPASVVDASDVMRTLDGGAVSTLGHAATAVERDTGLGARLGIGRSGVDGTERVSVLTTAVRRATLDRLGLPCDPSSAARALVVTAGPPSYLDREGIGRARSWLETEAACPEVRGGDYPRPGSDEVAALVVLSGIGGSDYVRGLLEEESNGGQDGGRRTAAEALVEDDRLDDLI